MRSGEKILHPAQVASIKSVTRRNPQCANLKLSFYKAIQQIHATINMHGGIEAKRQHFSYRPLNRPKTKESIKTWRQYACKPGVHNTHLVKLTKYVDEDTEMDEIDAKLPLQILVLFRHLASKEMQGIYTYQFISILLVSYWYL